MDIALARRLDYANMPRQPFSRVDARAAVLRQLAMIGVILGSVTSFGVGVGSRGCWTEAHAGVTYSVTWAC